MPLQGQTVDVPIQMLNQQAPTTAGPVGRIKTLFNGLVKKIQRTEAGAAVRVEKRDGFAALPTAVHDPATGATSSKTMSAPGVLTTFREQLLAVCKASPFVLSDAATSWESPAYVCPSQVLREAGVYVGSRAISSMDSARVGDRTMYAWKENDTAAANGKLFISIIDDDGVAVLKPLAGAAAATSRVKVASDGARFWLVADNGAGNLVVSAYDTNGFLLNTNFIALTAGSYFDVTVDTVQLPNGVFTAMKDPGGGVKFTRWTWNGSTVNAASTTQGAFLCATGRVAFLRNDRGDGNLYVATVNGAGPFDFFVWQATSPGAGTFGNGHQYTVATAQAAAPFEITGWVAATGNADITAALSFLNAVPIPQMNFTDVRTVTFGGVSTLQRTYSSHTLVSRPLLMDGNYYAVGYYASDPTNTVTQVRQSTHFLLTLQAPYQVCGRWDNGTAYADWQTTAATTYYMALSTPTVDQSGGIHVALPYRARSSTAEIRITTPGSFFKTVGPLLIKDYVDNVGINDVSFGPDHGQPVSYADETLLPGPWAVSFAGSRFAEHGVPLIPEITSLTQSNTGGAGLTLTQTYEYIAVAEWTDDNGNRVRGPAGAPVSITLTGANQTVTVNGLMIHGSAKPNMLISLYRTAIINGVQSSIHYKVTGGITSFGPTGLFVYNDDSAGSWSAVDTAQDTIAQQNEPLYTDKGLLDRFPAPPFSNGCAAFNRVFLVGPDNAIWFSGEKTEGDALWFTPAFRITLPTHERIKTIRQVDNFLLVMCERSAVFSIPGTSFPDATGTGAIPEPTRLPFTNGCTGFAEITDNGVMYSSTQGGIWMITRDLRNVYIGAPVEDDTASGIIGSASDDKQRVMFVMTSGTMVVYDDVTGAWSTWLSAAFDIAGPAPATSHHGRFVVAAIGTPAVLYRQALDTYDDGGIAIPTTIELAFIHFGGIRGYVRIWQSQMEGIWYGDHDLTVTGFVDDDDSNLAIADTWSFTPAASQPYVYELPSKHEICSSRAYKFQDSFPRGPSRGFALEAMSFYVGVAPGLGRLPATKRIRPG